MIFPARSRNVVSNWCISNQSLAVRVRLHECHVILKALCATYAMHSPIALYCNPIAQIVHLIAGLLTVWWHSRLTLSPLQLWYLSRVALSVNDISTANMYTSTIGTDGRWCKHQTILLPRLWLFIFTLQKEQRTSFAELKAYPKTPNIPT